MTTDQLRDAFIAFFKSQAHQRVSASPVVLHNDPTLLFVNAGMNQFKDVFLGEGERAYTRAVNSQPCIRVSGKHNDLEEVGRDTYHLTSFEMLGNWSFGDFYKKEAIQWGWQLLTEQLKLPKAKLYATVYETDDESDALWKELTDINPDHVLRFGKEDNFWEMADTGPCGPCSELHVDRGSEACDKQGFAGHVCQVNGDCARYIELWNLVFIQYDRQADASLIDLPKTHVDTGAGLERLAAYMQNVISIYDTDGFVAIIDHVAKLSGRAYSADESGTPFRVIADHLRTLVFAISDNVLPANDGRGYVLRRILRRAMRFAKQLGFARPVLYEVIPTVIAQLKNGYPQIAARETFIQEVIKAEEESFLKTLAAGETLFEQAVQSLQSGDALSGEMAFQLYDTYGFPIDLTELMAEERGITVDKIAFDAALNAQKERSRQSAKLSQSTATDSQFGTLKKETDTLIYGTNPDTPTGGEVICPQTDDERLQLARHHTATHLLQRALRETLGDHVFQAGSLVDTMRLRFDFSHFKALSDDEKQRIATMVNDDIASTLSVSAEYTSLDAAKENGAMSLFGEKYPDEVRVISIGDISMELCGGNHVKNTQQLEAFKLVSETGIATGTRRIEAIVGHSAIAAYDKQRHDAILKTVQDKYAKWQKLEGAATLPAPANTDTIDALHDLDAKLTKAIKSAQKNAEKKAQAAMTQDLDQWADRIERMGDYQAIIAIPEGAAVPQLKTLADHLADKYPKVISILGAQQGDKLTVVVKLGRDCTHQSANTIIKQLTSVAGGSGGGRDQMAQAGGLAADRFDAAIEQLKQTLCAA